MTGIAVDGSTLTVTFDDYGLESYRTFLRTKLLPESEIDYNYLSDSYRLTSPARFASLLGAQAVIEQRERLPLAPHLFDYQRWVVDMALTGKRFAVWIDTGLGKTIVFMEWARQVVHLTGGRIVIFTPLQVVPQVIEECLRFYGDTVTIEHIDSRAALAEWCKQPGSGIAITNHHKMVDSIMPELRYLAGVVLDEADILKAGGGVIKWNLIHSCKGIEYKLSCTATPAPNDTMEYASQASWLEKLRAEGDILWTFFTRDKAGNWRVKAHAREAFYQFMASWSIYMRDPAHFGFADILSTLPPPDIREYEVPITDAQRELMQAFQVRAGKGMFTDDRMGVQERSKLAQLARGFLYDGKGKDRKVARIESLKPAFVANLVRQDVGADLQCLVWTVFDEESNIIREELSGMDVAVLDGSMSDDARLDVLNRFRHGEVRALISKASLIGYGLNLQHCRSQVFSGFDDSFARFYQAGRRSYRYGQLETVRMHIPYVAMLEGMMLTNIKQKETAFLRDVAIQEDNYRKALGAVSNAV